MTTSELTGRTRATARDDPPLALLSTLAFTRLRHGLPLWAALLPPLVMGALLALTVFTAPTDTRDLVWDHWLALTLYLWAVVAPMSAGLYAIGAHQADEDAKRVMYAYAFPRHRHLIAALATVTALWAASALLLTSLITAAALVHGTPADALTALPGTLVPVLATLPTLVLCLLAAEAWGMAGPACVGVAGMLFGALTGDKPYWWAIPPAWPTRSVIPIAETRGIGDYFAPDHPLLDPAALPAILGAAAVLTTVLVAVGAWYIDRKEV
ncbi:ABC-2 type transport system permease protein [Nocardiopsis mwathae]|uniref:ABC-2 type transport system permease protein n=1 Tax=Nocardiopsis mwathae TaxID=1472723 RepID=A0A7W9YP92_9ACTN|nr:hypothetical protein [Nocardiopsis mwathae]MBB6174716.1 ABC-2 type transport system permease protein [Nocardiopsis mwathae]